MEKKSLTIIQKFSPRSFVRQRVWQSDQLHCNLYCLEPGQQNSLHRHPDADEVVFCWEGEGLIVSWQRAVSVYGWRQRACPKGHSSWVPEYESGIYNELQFACPI